MSGASPVAVVTGGGRGIGRAIAKSLVERGCDVVLLGRSLAQLEETAHTLVVAHSGRRAVPVVCDVSRSADVEHARDIVLAQFGPPDVVVNNAGGVVRALLVETSESAWDSVIDANLKGPFLVTRAFLPAMQARRQGRFIAIGSVSGTLGTARLTAYCASKWGVLGFTKALAEELRGTGLETMCVMPGSVDTAMLAGSGFAPQMTAQDVAKVVAYAALDAPAAMNGSALEVFGP